MGLVRTFQNPNPFLVIGCDPAPKPETASREAAGGTATFFLGSVWVNAFSSFSTENIGLTIMILKVDLSPKGCSV